MRDRNDIFGEPEPPRPAGTPAEQRTRIPQARIQDDDDGGDRRQPPRNPPAGPRKRKGRLILAIVADVLAAALILLVFYITNYEVANEQEGIDLPAPTKTTASTPTPTQSKEATPGPSGSVEPTLSPTPSTATDPTSWRGKFADKFTTGEVVQTENSYKSANINVSYEKKQNGGVVYYVVDIYLADLKYFKTAFAKNPDKMGATEHATKIGQENNAVVAINGDYCSANRGVVIRNGKWYPNGAKESDQLVLNYDGTMQTYTANELDVDKLKSQGAWQVWTFGPMLLKDGKPMTEFNSTLMRANARSAIGYYEPGHYCFVMVDVGNPSKSDGMTLTQLSKLFADLKCKAAFNLDGGHSAEMAFGGKTASKPQDGGRPVSDIVYIPKE